MSSEMKLLHSLESQGKIPLGKSGKSVLNKKLHSHNLHPSFSLFVFQQYYHFTERTNNIISDWRTGMYRLVRAVPSIGLFPLHYHLKSAVTEGEERRRRKKKEKKRRLASYFLGQFLLHTINATSPIYSEMDKAISSCYELSSLGDRAANCSPKLNRTNTALGQSSSLYIMDISFGCPLMTWTSILIIVGCGSSDFDDTMRPKRQYTTFSNPWKRNSHVQSRRSHRHFSEFHLPNKDLWRSKGQNYPADLNRDCDTLFIEKRNRENY
ncbi:hypothetical protein C4D60_Mb06t30350 [Musa balbisiana]|uniref:Uncharacterized protein n=1 Tax=Musa balbisiana TaxID=52838 RepID=A0A4S8IRS9_MUSBA|nr:hypothetical protein C4D60_Mb06t30350 [Musa balbisiana]